MTKTPEQIAISKHRENILRLQTWGKLRGFEVNEDTILKMKRACIAFFEEHPESQNVPASVLLSCLEVKSREKAVLGFKEDVIGEPRREKTKCETCGEERETAPGKGNLSPFCSECLKSTEAKLSNWRERKGLGV